MCSVASPAWYPCHFSSRPKAQLGVRSLLPPANFRQRVIEPERCRGERGLTKAEQLALGGGQNKVYCVRSLIGRGLHWLTAKPIGPRLVLFGKHTYLRSAVEMDHGQTVLIGVPDAVPAVQGLIVVRVLVGN